MPNYHPAAKSLIYGLSDFWTMYFKELPLLEEIYAGVEIDVGQSYLDLLTLLLNNSTQDAALFDKQYFKLLRLREDTVTYGNDLRYGIALAPDVAGVKYVNNKVFGSTVSFEKDRDFLFDADTRSLLFKHDIFAAYRARTFGTGLDAFTVTSVVPEPVASLITLELVDAAVHPPVLTRTEYALTVTFDSVVTSTIEVIALINNSAISSGLVQAALRSIDVGAGLGTLTASGAVFLERQATAPVKGFAARTFDVLFGTRFTDALVPRWLNTDVQKGDVLRVIGGSDYGPPQEFPVALVREDALILYPQVAPLDVPVGLEYAVLRDAADSTVSAEPMFNIGNADDPFDTTATVVASTRTIVFGTPAYALSDFYVGAAVTLSSPANAGEYRVREVIAVPPSVVVDGNPLVDEVGVSVRLGTAIAQTSTGPNATLTGTAFVDLTAAFTSDLAGGVLLVRQGGTIYRCAITTYVSPTELTIAPASGLVAGAGLEWAAAQLRQDTYTFAFAPPAAWVTPGSVEVAARRFLDGQAVQEGRDYVVNVDTGGLTLRTVWRATQKATVSYSLRVAITTSRTALQAGTDGSLTASPNSFSSPTAAFTEDMVGAVLRVTGTDDPLSEGPFRIDAVTSPTVVEVTRLGGTSVFPDPFNGSLVWALESRAAAVVTDVVEPVTELGVWAPDALVDRYHLYYTYGYLINRVQVSSESYRSLIRGVFQLFMLGPTLERFESAVNVVAGLPVVRDDGEIFIEYDNGALRSGTDGIFDATTRTFTSATAAFTPSDLSNQIFVVSGYNTRKSFGIAAVLDSTSVELLETPTTDTSISWEITSTSTHTVRTTRDTYVLPRTAPVKAKFLEPSNAGTLTLRAFEVLSSAFEVTDYVETPAWWENATIPAQLLPAFPAERRRSTPALFENIVDAGDGSCVGDPGFYVGADDEGNVPPTIVLAAGVGDGSLLGDPLYPARTTETFFSAASAALTAKDVGNYIRVAGVDYRISAVISPTEAKIVSYLPLPYDGLPLVDWELIAGTIPLRHTAAYMIMDHVLKYHMFTVRFDAYLLDVLQTDVISDLQELVFAAKPTYTYLTLTPSLLFDEIIRVTEPEFSAQASLMLGGQGGEDVIANANPLRVDGSWYVGGWFRYAENSSTFSASVDATIPTALGTPPADYSARLSRVYIDPVTFQQNGRSAPYDYHNLRVAGGFVPGGDVLVSGGETFLYYAASPGLGNEVLMNFIEIQAPSPNAGVYRIGRVVDGQTVCLDFPTAIPEIGVTFRYLSGGTQEGALRITAEGESTFYVTHGGIDISDVGSYVRRVYPLASKQQVYRIDEKISGTLARLATRHYVTVNSPVVTLSSLSGYTITFASMYVNDTMTYNDRRVASPSTAKQREYFLELISGPYAGTTVALLTYLSPVSVVGSVYFNPGDTNVQALLYYREHYAGVPEGGSWERYTPQVIIDNAGGSPDTVVLPTAGVAAATVDYTAHGVFVADSPFVATFDETLGDTYYCVDGLDPVSVRTRTRTAYDTDLFESPVSIARLPPSLPVALKITEDGVEKITEDGDNKETE